MSDESKPIDWRAELLDKVGIGAFEIEHSSGTITKATDALADLFGFPNAEAMIGISVLGSFEDPKEREEAAARVYSQPGLKEKGYVRIEAKRKRLDTGEPLDVLMSLVPTFGEDGKVKIALGLLENISDRKAADKSFRTGAERFRVLFDRSPVGMVLMSPDGLIGRANESFCEFLGQTESELRDGGLLTHVHAEDRKEVELMLELNSPDPAEALPTHGIDWRFLHATGRILWGQLNAFWITEDDVSHSRCIMVQDITSRKQMEEGIRRVEKLQAIGRLAGGLAHDFNNILAIIMGRISLAQGAAETGEETAGHLADAEDACRKARALTRQLVAFSAGGTPQRQPTRLEELARAAAGLCLRGSGIHPTYRAAADLPAAEVDPGQLEQVFLNIFCNALDAIDVEGSSAGAIDLHMEGVTLVRGEHPILAKGNYIRTTVADNGCGIPVGTLPQVFEPFFTTKEGGSGLGLASVHSILRSHGGHIEVATGTNGGARFTFWVQATDESAVRATEEREDAPSRLRGSGRILVMDDDPAVRDVLCSILERNGFDVVGTTEGRSTFVAWQEARDRGQPFDLVVLDIVVENGLGGAETLSLLKAADSEVKAIICSGYDVSTEQSGSDLAATAYLQKPFAAARLLAAVHKVVGAEE
jgi:PAS domain S-box-containing protein